MPCAVCSVHLKHVCGAGATAEIRSHWHVSSVCQAHWGPCLEDGPSLESGCGGKVTGKNARMVGGVAGSTFMESKINQRSGNRKEQMLGVDQLPALRDGRPFCQRSIQAPGEMGSLPRGLNGTSVRAVGSRLVPRRHHPRPDLRGRASVGSAPYRPTPSRLASVYSIFRKARLKEPVVSSWPPRRVAPDTL